MLNKNIFCLVSWNVQRITEILSITMLFVTWIRNNDAHLSGHMLFKRKHGKDKSVKFKYTEDIA